MFSRSKNTFIYAASAVVFFMAGLACDKLNNKSGISNSEVVAVVGNHQITFGDWMKQLDLLQVFTSSIDPENSKQVEAVLDSLVDQQLVLEAAQKDKFSDAAFDKNLQNELVAADLKIKKIKDKLEKDTQTVKRMEKGYQEEYKKMLLARAFAASQVDKVEVTRKDLKDSYDQYEAQAKVSGQKLPPFEKVESRLKPSVQAEKFLKNLQAGTKVERKEDVITKYLNTLSAASQMLSNKNEIPSSSDNKDAAKK